ncbi:MAG: rhomboid family intramembrane serine protease [Collimonas sp.]|uniref:rhomboid family intramembrane serine protease n=1 Tax=Collimonas sp. TaxID=1963772 RepID=UPI00326520D4
MEKPDALAPDTFAVYLAKQYMAKKGLVIGTVPEASALAEASDIILTGMSAMSFQIICIIDCEANPGRQFKMAPEAVEEIGKQCRKYSGSINGSKMPVSIQIMEIGKQPIGDPDRARLKGFKRRSVFSKAVLSTWIIDSASATVWTNAPFNGRMVGRSFIEQMMREPRVGDAMMRPLEATVQIPGRPWLTYGLLAILAAVFAAEQIYAVAPSSGLLAPSVQTLVALGGLTYDKVVQGGEWYRIFSATLLHGDLFHLIFNGVALWMAGVVLENLVGRAWFFALFVLGAVSGSLMSLAINQHTIVSVGASGAIMGLLAAAFVCSFRLPDGANRSRIHINMLQILIPSMIPLAVSRTGQHIDFGAHLGGAISGALLGLAMLKTWPITKPLPRLTGLATALSCAGLAAFVFTLAPITQHYGNYALDKLLIPNDQLPESTAEKKLHSADLVARYPRDPRAHFFRAAALVEASDSDGVVHELRTGLEEKEILETKFSPDLESRMETMLAFVLLDKGQRTEAKTVALRVCAKSSSGPMHDALFKSKLCE